MSCNGSHPIIGKAPGVGTNETVMGKAQSLDRSINSKIYESDQVAIIYAQLIESIGHTPGGCLRVNDT